MFMFRRLQSISTAFIVPCRIRYEKRNFAKAQFRHPQAQLQQLVTADTNDFEKHKNGILHMFPNARATLNGMYNNLNANLDPSYKCQNRTTAVGRVRNQLVFHSVFSVNWPKSLTFNGYGFKKKDSELNAMIKALEFLYEENLITLNGHPVTVSEDAKQKLFEELSRPPAIVIPSDLFEEGCSLLVEYEEAMQPYLEKRNESLPFIMPNLNEDSEDEQLHGTNCIDEDSEHQEELLRESDRNEGHVVDLLTGRVYANDPNASYNKSRQMQAQLSRRLSFHEETPSDQKMLPMSQYKDDLKRALSNSQIVIVSGDTGCGKSTQVPQMILDEWIKEEKGADCNILISQPRRISAISLAKYVAFERRENLGESVGYHVRLSYKRLRERGGIMFLTTGMLLQGLHSNPSLQGVSHVIVDEVHERSVPTDLLLILLRRLTLANPDLKLILMSASLSTVQLQNYFGSDSTLIEVPGTLYPLTRHYLGDALSELALSPRKYELQPLMEPGSYPVVNIDLVLDTIRGIDSTKPPGAILCFLPGWQDISFVQRSLDEDNRLKGKLYVLPLHSRLSTTDQEKIFEAAPGSLRKVVLATNLAETSLTVADVVYVIDTGCHKEQRYNHRKDLTVLGNHWISKANGQQRAGRAGRVQPGEVFHLYSESIYKEMSSFPVPEIMRISLEHVILQCKAHCGQESSLNFLSDGLSVPSTKSIAAAVRYLEDLGMLISKPGESVEKLTHLGYRVVHFSTPPHLSKALVYSSIFKCVDSALSISAALSSGRGIFHNSIERRSDIRKTKLETCSTSDLLAMLGLIQQWEDLSDYRESIEYCNDHHLSHRGLMFNEGIKKVTGDQLRSGLMVDNDDDMTSPRSKWNENYWNHQLVLGILLAGVNRVLHLQRGKLSKGILRKDSTAIKTMKGEVVKTVSDCVLHTITKDNCEDSQHLLCVHLIRDDASRRTIARDLSLLHPLTVALFAGHSVTLKPSEDGYILSVDGEHKLSFSVDSSTGKFLSELRRTVDHMVGMIIGTRGLDEPVPENFEHLCDKLVEYVSTLLKKEGPHAENIPKRSILYDDDEDW